MMLIGQQSDAELVVIIPLFLISIIFLGIIVLWLVDRIRNFNPSKSEIEEEHFRMIERLKNPDIPALEAHFGHNFPKSLAALYQNQSELLRTNFEVATGPKSHECYEICFYLPADKEALGDRWPGCENYFAFANDGGGNCYVVDPKLEDPPVLQYDHEVQTLEPICQALSQFMALPRRTPV